MAEYRSQFEAALCDDLNSSMAITVLYDMLKSDISDATKYALAESFDEVLSLDLTTAHAAKEAENSSVDAELESYVLAKIEERKAAKKEKDFARADAIRSELLEKGIVLEDTREGVKWKKA
jgi:cysteinyl-tRNA synthetase